MRVTGWHVEGFGHLSGVGVQGVGPHLTVLVGRNESGKTTTHHALRWILFGFPAANSAAVRRYKPARGPFGGRVFVHHAGHDLVLERFQRDKAPALRAVGGGAAPGIALGDLLGTADLGLYERIFAVGVDQLQSIPLDDDGVREQVFAAALVGGGRSADGALRALDERNRSLLGPRSGRIRDLQRELLEVVRALDGATAATASLGALRAAVTDHERGAEEARARRDDRRDEQRRLEKLVELWPHWAEATAGADDIDDTVPELGPDPLGRLEAELDAISVAGAAEAAVADEVAHLEAALDRLEVDDDLAPAADEARRLLADLPGHRARRDDLRTRTLDLVAERRSLADDLARLGPGWDAAAVAAVDTSVAGVHELRRLAERAATAAADVAAAERAHGEAVERAERAATARQRAEAAVAQARSSVPRGDAERARAAVGQLRQTLPRLTTARAIAARQADHRATLAVLGDQLDTRPPGPPSWLVPVLAVVAVALGAGAGLALLGGAAAVAALVGVGAAAVAAVAVAVGVGSADPTSPTERAEAAHRHVVDAAHDPDTARLAAEVAGLAASLGLPDEPTPDAVERVGAAADHLAHTDHLAVVAAGDEAEARRAEQRAAARVAAALQESDELATGWASHRRRLGLVGDLGPAAAADLVARLEQVQRQQRSVAALAGRVAELDQQLADERARWRAVLAAAGVVPPTADDDLESALVELGERIDADADARADRRNLVLRLRDARNRLTPLGVAVREAEKAVLDRLAAAGVASPDELRALVGRAERSSAARRQRDALDQALRAAFGAGAQADAARAALGEGDVAGWERRLAALADEVDALAAEHDEAVQRAVEARHQLERLERSDEVAVLAQRAEALRAELADAVETWAVQSLARTAIDTTLRRFERERQPEVVRDGGERFARITGRRWTSILPGDGDLAVLDAHEGRLGADHLSRGATEQLYLSMRLALARSYARQRGPLPILLDDVLVDSDDDRRRRMAHELAVLADELQVIVLTANEETAELLVDARPDTVVIDVVDGAGTVRRA